MSLPLDPPRRRRPRLATPCATGLLLVLAGCGGNGAPPASAEGSPNSGAMQPLKPVIVPAATQAPKPTGPLEPDVTCLTARCHASLGTGRFVHGVVRGGDCFVCHEQDAGGHVYPLRRPGNEGCLHCHQVGGTEAHQHAAIEVNGCTGCHDPHGSNHRFMMTQSTVKEMCLQCHVLDEHAVPHGPNAAGECQACHESHESRFAGLLRGGEGPAHCAICHADTASKIEQARRVHAPAAISCVSCHDPHSSDNKFALLQPVERTCFECHADIEKVVEGAMDPHPAVSSGAQCGNCHDPHAADRERLLREDQVELCLNCHDQSIVAADGRTIPNMEPLVRERDFLHGPVKSGNCVACHTIHGGTHSRLLRDRFTSDFYSSFDLTQYALCFDCHDSALVTAERTTDVTDFRNGDVNLHYLHVNRQTRGRTCRACHEIHGSNLPAHVAESVPFEGSQWSLPIGFEKTESGGSCAPGCHQPEKYERFLPPEPQIEGAP